MGAAEGDADETQGGGVDGRDCYCNGNLDCAPELGSAEAEEACRHVRGSPMKALSILLLASVCAGQQPTGSNQTVVGPVCTASTIGIKFPNPNPMMECTAYGWVQMQPHRVTSEPLKCGKYEYATIGMHGEVCAPIMHEVTEAEWQDTVSKLATLEKKHDLLYDSYITLLKKLGTIGAKSGAGKE